MYSRTIISVNNNHLKVNKHYTSTRFAYICLIIGLLKAYCIAIIEVSWDIQNQFLRLGRRRAGLFSSGYSLANLSSLKEHSRQPVLPQVGGTASPTCPASGRSYSLANLSSLGKRV
jgi:hypothetical protein